MSSTRGAIVMACLMFIAACQTASIPSQNVALSRPAAHIPQNLRQGVGDIENLVTKWKQRAAEMEPDARHVLGNVTIDSDDDRDEIREKHMKRMGAALRLGRYAQAREEADAALASYPPHEKIGVIEQFTRIGIWNMQTIVSSLAGDFGAFFETAERNIDLYGKRVAANRVARGIVKGLLAAFYARVGDIANARRSLKDSRRDAKMIEVIRYPPAFLTADALLLYHATQHYGEAGIAAAEGRLDEALKGYEAAFTKLDSTGWGPLQGPLNVLMLSILNARAEVLRDMGDLIGAEIASRSAITFADKKISGTLGNSVNSLWQLAETLFAQGRYRQAETLVRASIDFYAATDIAPSNRRVVLLKLLLTRIMYAKGRYRDAANTYTELRSLGRDEEILRLYLDRFDVDETMLLLRIGDTDQALARAEELHRHRSELLPANNPDLLAARAALGAAEAANGKWEAAARRMSEALPLLLSDTSGANEARTHRDLIQRELFGAYLGVLRHYADGGRTLPNGANPAQEGFRLLSLVQGRKNSESLVASLAARGVENSPIRQRQEIRRRIAKLRDSLGRIVGAGDLSLSEENRTTLEAELVQARGKLRALETQVARTHSEFEALTKPVVVTVDEAAAALAPQQALVAQFSSADALHSWAVTRDGSFGYAATDIGDDELELLVTRVRRPMDELVSRLDRVSDFDVEAAYRLYRAAFGDVEDIWKDAEELIVSVDGRLASVPPAMLTTSTKPKGADDAFFSGYRDIDWLIRRVSLVTIPSPSVLLAVSAKGPSTTGQAQFVGFGDPVFDPKGGTAVAAVEGDLANRGIVRRSVRRSAGADLDDAGDIASQLSTLQPLPDTRRELSDIAGSLSVGTEGVLYLGPEANEVRVRSMKLDDRQVIAFATHALIPGDLPGLTEPALALSHPELVKGAGKIENHDGLLTMSEVANLRLDADFVVLSACNTAAGEGEGADAVSGLGNAFFNAGARALLATHWAVETVSAAALTSDLFADRAGDRTGGWAASLRKAMLRAIDGPGRTNPNTGETVFSYAHPLFWAPFAFFGDSGRLPSTGWDSTG